MQVILGTKIGMTQIIGEDGVVTPVTILQAGPCTVTQIKTVETDGYNAVQVGYGQGKNLSKSVTGHVKKAGENINPKVLKEFRVEELPEGEHYVRNLVGCRVVDLASGSEIGELNDVIQNTAQSILDVRTADGKQVLIPAVDAFLRRFDDENRIIEVELIPGFI